MDYQATEPSDESPEIARPGQLSSNSRGNWKQVVLNIWNKIFDDEILGRAAQLAYYWLFSIFPFLILLTALISDSPLYEGFDRLLYELRRPLTPEAFRLIYNTFHEVTGKESQSFLSISILIAVWAASTGMSAVISSLNKTFDVKENRPWWKEKILAILLTLGLTFFIIAALVLLIFGEHLYKIIEAYYGERSILPTIWTLAQWPVTILFVLFAVELIYYFAPNIKQKWELFTPGAVFALVCWLLITFGFRFYISNFTNYNVFYGALGGFMVLMIWLYLMGVAILAGGVINSVVRRDNEINEK